MDRIKISVEKAFVDKKTLQMDGWKWHYSTREYARSWTRKLGGCLFIYYPRSKRIIIDFSAPRVVYGHNVFDFRIQDKGILFEMLDSAIKYIFPDYSLPRVYDWNVVYVEFTKNIICNSVVQKKDYLEKVVNTEAIAHFDSQRIKRYDSGIFVKNSTRFIRVYEKKAEMASSGNSDIKIAFEQMHFEIGYYKGGAILQRFKTRKLNDILSEENLTGEINRLMNAFSMPEISSADFYLTNERQRCHISVAKSIVFIRNYLVRLKGQAVNKLERIKVVDFFKNAVDVLRPPSAVLLYIQSRNGWP